MKKLALFFAFALLTQLAIAQSNQSIDVGNFSEVSIGGGYTVEMTKGSSTSVKLEGNEEDLSKIEVINEGGRLKIRNKKKKNGWGWSKMGRVRIYITFKKLDALYSSGSSSITVKSEVKAGNFKYVGSGSGDTKLSVDADNLEATISGSGEVELDGAASNQTLKITGSGGIRAIDLKSQNAEAIITGSGSMKLHAVENLKVRITGSGSIRYKGDPRQEVKITGSGSVRRM